MRILVEWTIRTKCPGDEKDYRIPGSSIGGLDEQASRKWLTGEVPVEANPNNPAAPWYQFGIVKDPLRQVVIRQEWTGYADYIGRPVLRTICLLLPFSDLAKRS